MAPRGRTSIESDCPSNSQFARKRKKLILKEKSWSGREDLHLQSPAPELRLSFRIKDLTMSIVVLQLCMSF